MEGRKEAFRMYLEQTGTTDALAQVFVKLHDLKDQRPDNEADALKFIKDNLSNNFPTQSDYDNLLKEVEESRKKVAAIREAESKALVRAEVERQERKARRKAAAAAVLEVRTEYVNIGEAEVLSIADARERLEQLKKIKNCKSLLVQCLELTMLDSKNSDYLDDLLPCIRRGLEDPNIPVGIYAAKAESYVTFKAIFGPIITKYFGENSPVKSDWMNSDDKIGDSSLNFRSHLVRGTRITCARSIARFPFVPVMDDVQFKKVKTIVEAELKLLTHDDVKGKYLDLTNLKAISKEILEEGRLLPEPNNKQLIAADANNLSDVPAIFCNDHNDLVVWVNEEEHLKFIATGKDCVKEPFIHLRNVVENCGFLKFTQSGGESVSTDCYLTFSPTYLGPAIHVSATVKWANVLTRGKVKEIMETNEICVLAERRKIQHYSTLGVLLPVVHHKMKTLTFCVRLVKAAAEPGHFEVTNKPKLDKNEFEAVQEFITNLSAFLDAARIKTSGEALARLQELKALTPPPKSLLVKVLTDELFNELKGDEATQKTFLNCIRLGLEDETLPLGINAATPECYVTFIKLFDPIIKEYNGTELANMVPSKWDSAAPVDDEKLYSKSHLIRCTRMTCAKSIDKYAFVPSMDATKLDGLKKKVTAALGGSAFAANCPGTTIDLDQLNGSAMKTELEEKQLLFEAENVRLRAAGAFDFSNRAIFFNTDKNLVVWINEEEHLKFIATGTNTGNDGILKDTFIRMRTAVQTCGLPFRKGNECHLTFSPTYLGPTIHISAVVKFPNVAERAKVEEMLKSEDALNKLKICVKSTKVKDEFEVTNKPKLDQNEFQAIEDFIANVGKFLEKAQIKTMDDALPRLKELQNLSPRPESLLVTQITDTILEAARNVPDAGKTVINCIRLGLEDATVPVGVYAAVDDAYEKCATIFEPIVKAYFELADLSTAPAASGWDGNDDDLNLQSDLILRTRITCAKSIEGFPFVPAQPAGELETLKGNVSSKLIDGDFDVNTIAGVFKDLASLPDNEKAELEKEQLLFEAENVRLKAAGVTDFSEGRALFYSNDYKLAVWVNEEEHLKFIATGSLDTSASPVSLTDIFKETFISLRTVVKHCESLTFKKSGATATAVPKDCHLTFCPTYLGPAIHVSVTVKLEKAAARGMVSDIAETLQICVKPTKVKDEFEVTNKPKLDKTEFDAMTEFIGEVKKLLDKEGELLETIDEAWTLWVKLSGGSIKSTLLDLMRNDKITEDDFKSLRDIPTDNKKYLLDCIRPGLEDEMLPVGIYAVDNDAYEKYATIFAPIVEAVHGLQPTEKQDDDDAGAGSALIAIDAKYAKSSTISCRRSFNNFPFIPAMNATHLRELRAKVKTILEEYDSAGTFYDLEGIDEATKKHLVEKKHWFEPVNKRLRTVGVTDFTTGRAVFVNKIGTLIVWVCEEDHLKFISTDVGKHIGKTFDRLKEAVAKFEKKDLERHAKWGWKTFCPTNLGTTIEAKIVLDLPKIAAAAGTDLEAYCKDHVEISGAKMDFATSEFCVKQVGTSSEYEISNKKKFGKEIDLVKAVYDGAAAMVTHEGGLP